jgi:hypothetical protein
MVKPKSQSELIVRPDSKQGRAEKLSRMANSGLKEQAKAPVGSQLFQSREPSGTVLKDSSKATLRTQVKESLS